VANSERGEIAITLAGTEYTMAPTFEAVEAIESRSGSAQALARKIRDGRASFDDLALIISEGIRAYADAKGDELNAKIGQPGVKKLVMRTGLSDVMVPVGLFMGAVLNGGVIDKDSLKGDAAGN
jgi:hypothetical protein